MKTLEEGFEMTVLGVCCFLHIFCSLFQLPDWIKIGDLTPKTCHLFVNLQSKGLKGGGIILVLSEYTIIQSIEDFILMQAQRGGGW